MGQVMETLAVWRNPVFRRYARSRLRLRGAIFWYLFAVIFPTFIVTLSYLIMTNQGFPAQQAARNLWIPLLIMQGLILMMKGTGVVSAGIIQDKIDQTLDYQRLTPLSPAQCIVGYLCGLPVLELVMFAITIPHVAFIAIVGNIPLSALVSVYFAFFVCVILYYMTAIAVGIVMNRWVLGYLLAIFMVLVINVVLPLLVSQLGLKFVQFLSVWPVIGQKVLPVVVPQGLPINAGNNPFFAMASDVYVYNTLVTPFVFTFFLQAALILTFFLMAYRRWQSATKHSLSKPYAVCFLAGFVLLVIGNVWPAITGQFLPFPIFGQTDLRDLTEVIAVAFPGIYSIVTWALAGTLMMIVTPGHHACVRGIRRALKLGRSAPRPWEDDSANMWFMSLFVVVVMTGFFVLYSELISADFFDFRGGADLGLWRLPVALTLVLIYTLVLLQVIELKPTVIVILLVWFLPILVAAVLSAAMQEANVIQSVIASISPIALVLMSSAIPLAEFVPIDAQDDFQIDMVVTGCATGILFVSAQIVFLVVRWRKRTLEFSRIAKA